METKPEAGRPPPSWPSWGPRAGPRWLRDTGRKRWSVHYLQWKIVVNPMWNVCFGRQGWNKNDLASIPLEFFVKGNWSICYLKKGKATPLSARAILLIEDLTSSSRGGGEFLANCPAYYYFLWVIGHSAYFLFTFFMFASLGFFYLFVCFGCFCV